MEPGGGDRGGDRWIQNRIWLPGEVLEVRKEGPVLRSCQEQSREVQKQLENDRSESPKTRKIEL